MIPNIQVILFLTQILLMYFFTRLTIYELFAFFRIFTQNEKVVFSLISLIFLPGTIVHELSHYLIATISMLNVKEVNIIPEFEDNYIKLGNVIYEKKDFIRSMIVGVAPLFFGLFIFWLIAYFKIFPQKNLWFNILFIYLIFTISSTMFSSKQDLKDLIFVIPLIVIIMLTIYVFNIKINDVLVKKNFINNLTIFAKTVNFYLLLSLLINFFLFFFLRTIRFFLKK